MDLRGKHTTARHRQKTLNRQPEVPSKSPGREEEAVKKIALIVAVVVLTVMPAVTDRTEAAWISLKTVEQTVTVQPGTKQGSLTNTFQVNIGSQVTITCAWKQVSFVQIDTEWDIGKKLAALNWQFPGEITLDGVKIKTFTVPAKNNPPTQGTESVQWLANKAGLHNGTCSVDHEKMVNYWGKKTIYFDIAVVEPAPQSGYQATQPTVPVGKFAPVAGPVAPTQPKGLPDITSAAQIMIGSVPAQWGATVNVDAKQAFSAQNGVCQFVVQHTARNIGLASTGSFDSLFKSSPVPGGLSRVWGSIAPGGQDTQKDLLSLKPGMNDLLLTLDHPGKVQEASETNNQFRVRVNVTGSCGPKPGIVPPPGGGQSGSSSGSGEPVPRLPDPSVTKRVTVQPSVTGVIPYLLTPGKGYTLMLQGQALTQQMALDFGPGITTVPGSVKIGGPEGMASVMVQVAPDAVPGTRTVKLASAPGQPWKAQPAKLAVFVEPAPREQGPLKVTPLK
jgi:hypothetical protein